MPQTPLSLDAVEKTIRDDPRAMQMVIVCALNDPRIFAKLQELVANWHAASDECAINQCEAVGLALADLINKHVHAHAVDAHQMAQAVILLSQPAANDIPH